MITLWKRELVRFYRDRSRVVGALTPPVLFWFVIGSGAGPAYLRYFYSGTLLLIVLFTSIFATISIIEDRREGFLQGVLVAPIPRWHIVLGKVLGGATVGLLQGLIFLAFAPLVGLEGSLLAAAVTLALASIGLTGLGFCIAWKLDSTQGFHGVMNLFLIPMWMLSGALFPAETAPSWLRAVMTVNPVTYGVSALQQSLAGAPGSLGLCWLVLASFAAVMTAVSTYVAARN